MDAHALMHRITAPQHRTHTTIATVATGTLVLVWAGTVLQWWWVPLAVGIIAGAVTGRRWTIAVTGVAAALVWSAEVISAAPLGHTAVIARVTGSLAGLGPNAGGLVIAATVLLPLLLAACGAWLGVAARQFVPVRAAAPATAEGSEPSVLLVDEPGKPTVTPEPATAA